MTAIPDDLAPVPFDVNAVGLRYVRGEGLKELCQEFGLKIGTLHSRLKREGYTIPPEERQARQQRLRFQEEGVFSWSLSDAQYERHRQRDFDRAEFLWSERLAGAGFDDAETPDLCGRQPRPETWVSAATSIAEMDGQSAGYRVSRKGVSS